MKKSIIIEIKNIYTSIKHGAWKSAKVELNSIIMILKRSIKI